MPLPATDPDRYQRIISALQRLQLDGFFCSLPSQVLLLSGYWPVMGLSAVIFTAGGEVWLLLPEDEEEIAQQSSAAERKLFQPARLDAIADAQTAMRGPLIELFKTLKLDSARIGIDASGTFQPASYAVMNVYLSGLHDQLRAEFPCLQLISADRSFEELKGSKTRCELEKIRATARIAQAAFEEGCEQIEAGVRESEVASRFQSAFDRMPLAAVMQRSYGFFFCMSGPNAAKASAGYARTRQRTIEEGDFVMMHCNSCGDGFWTDITRTYIAGLPSAEQEDMRSAIMDARAAALSEIGPGVHAKAVDRAARSLLEKRNFGSLFKHGTGHGVGFAAANPNAVPRVHPESPDVLAAGMTFNVEPAIYIDGYGGMRRCDMVAVTETGAEVLTDF
jgi:Xaa-Pro aminopeptidase